MGKAHRGSPERVDMLRERASEQRFRQVSQVWVGTNRQARVVGYVKPNIIKRFRGKSRQEVSEGHP